MDPLVAATRIAGPVAGGLSKRYSPQGVIRVGSREDRAQTYIRFLDAFAEVRSHFALLELREAKTQPPTERLFIDDELLTNADFRSASIRLIAALNVLRICAPSYVIYAAETTCGCIPDGVPKWKEYASDMGAVDDAFFELMEAVRHDLDYEPKWWQFWKRRKEGGFVRRRAPASLLDQAAPAVDQ